MGPDLTSEPSKHEAGELIIEKKCIQIHGEEFSGKRGYQGIILKRLLEK
jgi:hypothetical protein